MIMAAPRPTIQQQQQPQPQQHHHRRRRRRSTTQPIQFKDFSLQSKTNHNDFGLGKTM